MPLPRDRAVIQDEEEDGRLIHAIFRNDDCHHSLYRVYFFDGTFLEIDGLGMSWEEGFPPEEEGEEVEPGETGWEEAGWHDLPWEIRERVRFALEDVIAPQGEWLAEELLRHPHAEQLRLIEERSDLHEWGLAEALLRGSRESATSDPRRAADLLTVAERLTHFFGGYTEDRVMELRGRILAHLGNALRILGELPGAHEAFHRAFECLASGGSLDAGVTEGEILVLHAFLLRDEQRSDEALAALYRARKRYEAEGAFPLVAWVLVEEAKMLGDRGRTEAALALLDKATLFRPHWTAELRTRIEEEERRLRREDVKGEERPREDGRLLSFLSRSRT